MKIKTSLTFIIFLFHFNNEILSQDSLVHLKAQIVYEGSFTSSQISFPIGHKVVIKQECTDEVPKKLKNNTLGINVYLIDSLQCSIRVRFDNFVVAETWIVYEGLFIDSLLTILNVEKTEKSLFMVNYNLLRYQKNDIETEAYFDENSLFVHRLYLKKKGRNYLPLSKF